jgi:sugar transferase (PEP-CTERM/EpsH1 system associated)
MSSRDLNTPDKEYPATSANVLFVVRKLDVGGMERMVMALVNDLDRSQFTPSICTIEGAGRLAPELVSSGVEVIALNKPPGFSVRCIWRLRQLLKSRRVDIVHSHNETAHIYSSLANRSLVHRLPLIHTKHGRGTSFVWRSRVRNQLSARFSDVVVPVSADIEKLCREQEKIPSSKLKTITNGVDLQPYEDAAARAPDRSEFVIGHVGRHDAVKNQAALIRVFARFASFFPESRLEFVGDGPLGQELKLLSEDLGVSESVVFHGYRSDIPDLMAGFDLFAMSSISEGTPLVVIEAMAARCPVVATDVGGLRDMVDDDDTGYLVPADDEDAMLEKWLALARDRKRCRQLGVTAQSRARAKYPMSRMVEDYESLYRDGLAARNNQ